MRDGEASTDGKWRGLAYLSTYWSAVSDGTELVDGLQLDYLGSMYSRIISRGCHSQASTLPGLVLLDLKQKKD